MTHGGLARAVLALTGLGFMGFGLAYALWPLPMARLTQIPLLSPTARIDFAATYGGLQLGLGFFLLMCARRPTWMEPGLWAASASLGGLVLVRLLTLAAVGCEVTLSIAAGVALEGGAALLAGLALRQWRRNSPPA